MQMNSKDKQKQPRRPTPDAEKAATKKSYTTPQLTTYGSIEKLTQTGGKTTRDGGGGRRRH